MVVAYKSTTLALDFAFWAETDLDSNDRKRVFQNSNVHVSRLCTAVGILLISDLFLSPYLMFTDRLNCEWPSFWEVCKMNV